MQPSHHPENILILLLLVGFIFWGVWKNLNFVFGRKNIKSLPIPQNISDLSKLQEDYYQAVPETNVIIQNTFNIIVINGKEE